jgi:V-type H+-transporting ATPase subunit E
MDKEMTVKCRQQDVDSVNEVLEGVADDYEKALKSRPNFTVSDDYLPKSR